MKQCVCGRSKTQPYCDNTHKIKPILDQKQDIFLQMEQCKKDGNVLFLSEFMKNSPKWSDFVGLIDYQYNNPLVSESTEFLYNNSKETGKGPKLFLNKKGKSTNMYSLENLDLHILFVKQINGVSHEWYEMPHLDDFLSIFVNPNTHNTVKSLINFAGNESIGNIHADKQDVVSWTCAGEIEYRIYKVSEDETRKQISLEEASLIEYDSYIMKPGDVIYMPSGTFHQAIASHPRASLILDYD